MPPTLPARGRVRPAAVVNEAIRAVVRGARNRGWTQAERALYGVLCEEWIEAKHAEMVKAA